MDIIASMLFGSMLFMIVLTSNEIASETQTVYSGDMLVQEMLTSTVQLMEGEFRNMGYAVPRSQRTTQAAFPTSPLLTMKALCPIRSRTGSGTRRS
jgi:hypothetical protein